MTFIKYDTKKGLFPGEQYRVTLRVPVPFQKWYATAITDLLKLGDAADQRIDIRTIEMLRPKDSNGNIDNRASYFGVRITFNRTAYGFDPNQPEEAGLNPTQVFYLITGIIFSAIAITATLWIFEHAEDAANVIAKPVNSISGLVLAVALLAVILIWGKTTLRGLV